MILPLRLPLLTFFIFGVPSSLSSSSSSSLGTALEATYPPNNKR
jgi:hypothetical protein